MPRKTAARPRRKPGRPIEAGTDQRALLLDETAALIGRDGYAAMTLRDLAARAHVTPALVHYYFGSKAKLLDVFVAERIAPVFEKLSAPVIGALARNELPLPLFIHTYTTTMLAHPWLPPILAREVLAEGGALRERFLKQFARPMARRVPVLIAQAQAQGKLRSDLDPQLIALSLISMLVFPIVAGPVMRDALGLPTRADFADILVKHTTSVLLHGVEKRHDQP
jgi:TetR/AcrR family transcriptional regulator